MSDLGYRDNNRNKQRERGKEAKKNKHEVRDDEGVLIKSGEVHQKYKRTASPAETKNLRETKEH
jgi:hypothetical protein